MTSISASLTAADQQAVFEAIATIKAKLPFLVDLSTDDRKTMPKLGDKSRAFVRKALEIATQNPDFLPRSFDLDEMKRDVELFDALFPLMMSFMQMQELLDDTVTAVGSEAYSAALQVYAYAKASGNTGGLDAVVEEMGQRFARKSSSKKVTSAL